MKNYLPYLSKISKGKQFMLIAAMVGTSITGAMAQTMSDYDYRTREDKGGGDWRAVTTWQRAPKGTNNWSNLGSGQAYPTSDANSITILNNTEVYITANGLVVDQLTIDNGGILTIEYQRQITVNDAAGVDLQVNGTILAKGFPNTASGSNILRNGTSPSIVFGPNSTYQHYYQANPANDRTSYGVIPVATWDATSTLDIYMSGTSFSGDPIDSNFDQTFGNVKWNSPYILTGNFNLKGLLSNIQGDLEVTSTGGGQLFLASSLNADPNYTLNIGRDLKVLNDSKVFTAHANSAAGTFALNIGRSLEVNTTATFGHNKKENPIKVTFTGTNGVLNFGNDGGNMNFEVANNANITLVSNLSLPNNFGAVPAKFDVFGTLNISGSNAITGLGKFSLKDDATLGIGSSTGLNSINGNIRSNNPEYSTLANYLYNGIGYQTTGASLPATIAGLIIDNSGAINNVELTNSVTITKLLSLQNGTLSTAGKILTLIESPALVVTASNNSYVDGAVNYEVATSGEKTMLFPIGKNNVARPVTLTLMQGAGTNTYTGSQTETALSIASIDLPANVNSVSDKRHYTISQNGSAAVTDAFVILTYNTDEVVSNTEMRIIKSDGTGWMNLGGTLTANNTVTSTIPFTTFSQFAIAYKNIAPLPVELISFKAEKAETAVNVTWATASEKNNAYFSVERSADGKNFVAIGQVEGAGTTASAKTYAFLDKTPLGNVSYYRLKQVDLDGTSDYSQIVKVVNNKAVAASLNAFPNPTADKVNVQIVGLNEAATLQVMDLTGRVIAEQNIAKNALNTEVSLANYPAGMYQVKLVSANGATYVKVIKN